MPATPNQQLHIAICDDESIDRQQAADLTREIMEAEGLACSVSGYESAAGLLTARYLAKPLLEEQLREALLYCYKTFCEKKEILLPIRAGFSPTRAKPVARFQNFWYGNKCDDMLGKTAGNTKKRSARVYPLAPQGTLRGKIPLCRNRRNG